MLSPIESYRILVCRSGGLANIFGRRMVLIGALLIFAVGSAMCGAAMNMKWVSWVSFVPEFTKWTCWQHYASRPRISRCWFRCDFMPGGDCGVGFGFAFGTVCLLLVDSRGRLWGVKCEQRRLPGSVWCNLGISSRSGFVSELASHSSLLTDLAAPRPSHWWKFCQNKLPVAVLHEHSFNCGHNHSRCAFYESQNSFRDHER